MNIKRGQTPRGICSILDYRYGGLRYRPVLGYDLTTEQEQAAAIEVMVAIQVNVGLQAPQVNSSRQSVTFCEFAPRYIAYLEAKKLKALERPLTILNRHLIPHFGSITLKRLTMDHGLTYLTKRRAEGAALGTQRAATGAGAARRSARVGTILGAATACGGETQNSRKKQLSHRCAPSSAGALENRSEKMTDRQPSASRRRSSASSSRTRCSAAMRRSRSCWAISRSCSAGVGKSLPSSRWARRNT